MIDEARFWRHVTLLDDSCDACWIWVGAMRDDGRGKFWDGSQRRVIRAHWAAWELQHGSRVPKGHRLEQQCAQPQCVRHWKLGGKTRKLSTKDLAEIAKSLLGPTALAKRFGVHRRTVWRARLRTDVTQQTSGGRVSFAS